MFSYNSGVCSIWSLKKSEKIKKKSTQNFLFKKACL